MKLAVIAGAACLLALADGAGCKYRSGLPPGYQGIVELDERVIAWEVAGRVREVLVRRGDMVPDGAVLARLDDTLEQLTVKARDDDEASARADLALLRAGSRREDIDALAAEVQGAVAQEELARKTAAQVHALKATGAVADVEVDRADTDLERATAARESLEKRLRALQQGARPQEIARAEARLASMSSLAALEQERLSRHELRAKGDGMVVDVAMEPGELAAVGTPAVTMADVTHPYVDVFVPVGELDPIRLQVKAHVRADSTPATFAGAVEYVAPNTEFTPRFLFSEQERPHLVIRVRVRVLDPERRLHAGAPAFVQFDK